MPRPTKTYDRVAGKAAIVTGAGSPEGGIGRSIAMLLAAEGARICLIDQDEARAQEVADLIVADGGEAFAAIGDVSEPEDCGRMTHLAIERHGGPDILVNNVGISRSAPSLIDFDFAAWSRVIDVNLKSAVAMSSFVLPAMKAGGGGAIVNVASIAGMQAYGGAAYGPSKAAMIAFTRETALMHGRDGVRANVVAPGHVYTPHVGAMLTDELRAARRDVGPLGIEGDGWDVAEAVLFLASDAARFITGMLLPVDGGVTEIGPMAGHALITRGS
jgi:NAD(P)-dependent dehydrogenase (short-subunit alcohol dehydrogenase family)